MGTVNQNARVGAVREQLGRILASGDFDASARNRRFLKYVVEETLEGRSSLIKAYAVATSVFGRNADFDPQLDSIVRIEAGRLRQSLERYYLTAGIGDQIRITIPRGFYVAAFEAMQPAAPPGESSLGAFSPARRDGGTGNPSIFVMSFEEEGDQSAFPSLTRGFTRRVVAALTRFTDLVIGGPDLKFRPGSAKDEGASAYDLDVDFVVRAAPSISAGRLGSGSHVDRSEDRPESVGRVLRPGFRARRVRDRPRRRGELHRPRPGPALRGHFLPHGAAHRREISRTPDSLRVGHPIIPICAINSAGPSNPFGSSSSGLSKNILTVPRRSPPCR